ncbi:MAG: TolC family protein [Candidatus Omnitrophica bacterium]|nr:TolC family protein [Candidatus Omnitrophota bacterium]
MKKNNWFPFAFILIIMAPIPHAWAMAKKPPAQLETAPISLPPLTIEEAYQLALKRSEDLAIKGVELESTWGDFLQATSQALGTVDFDITKSYQQHQRASSSSSSSDDTSSLIRDQTRTRKFVISQPVFQGFKSLGALAGAGSLRKERLYDQKRAVQLLFMDVTSAFLSVQRSEKDVQILEKTYHLLQGRVGDLQKREQIGRSRLSEVTEAKSRMQSLESDLLSAQGTLMIQKRILEFLTGISLEDRALEQIAHLHEAPKPLESYLPDVKNRFDVQVAEQAMKVAFQNTIVTQSKLWPKITLDNNAYDQREGSLASVDWDLLLTVKVPLFQGGGAVGELKSAYSDWKKAKLTYEKTKREAELDLKKNYSSWNTTQKQFRALEEALKTSEENYRLQREDYSRSLVSNLDVLSALESLNQTRQRANEIFYQLQENYWQFQIARGSCCEPA